MAEKRRSPIDGRLDGLEAGQKAIAGDVTELRRDLTELRGDVTKLRTDVTELRTDVTALSVGQYKLEIKFEDRHQVVLAIADGLHLLGEQMERGFAEVRRENRETNAKLDTFIRAQSRT
jgi:hypothetical protein